VTEFGEYLWREILPLLLGGWRSFKLTSSYTVPCATIGGVRMFISALEHEVWVSRCLLEPLSSTVEPLNEFS
jgi:hypothetical protein